MFSILCHSEHKAVSVNRCSNSERQHSLSMSATTAAICLNILSMSRILRNNSGTNYPRSFHGSDVKTILACFDTVSLIRSRVQRSPISNMNSYTTKYIVAKTNTCKNFSKTVFAIIYLSRVREYFRSILEISFTVCHIELY